MMNKKIAVEARTVSKVFNANTENAVTALDNVSISIGQNKFFTLLGPSGCGNASNLLRTIRYGARLAGILWPPRGRPR